MAESAPRVAVASAMPEEIRALADRATIEQQDTWRGHELMFGTLGDRRVVLMHTGTGPVRARDGIAALLDGWPVEVLCYLGVAGALDPSLGVETLLVPTSVKDEDGRPAPSPDSDWTERAMSTDDACAGTLVTVDQVVTQPKEKAALRDALSLHGPLAIDMETAAVARVVAEREIAYFSLRVISDTADESLPDLLKDAQRDDGSIDRARVMKSTVWSPSAVPALMRMRRRVQEAAGIFADVVPEIVRRSKEE